MGMEYVNLVFPTSQSDRRFQLWCGEETPCELLLMEMSHYPPTFDWMECLESQEFIQVYLVRAGGLPVDLLALQTHQLFIPP